MIVQIEFPITNQNHIYTVHNNWCAKKRINMYQHLHIRSGHRLPPSNKMVSDYISNSEAGQADRPDRPLPAGPRFTLSPRYSGKQHQGIYRLSYLLQGSVNGRFLWGLWPRSQFVFDLFQAWPCVLALWRKCVSWVVIGYLEWKSGHLLCRNTYKLFYQFAIYTRWIRHCFILEIWEHVGGWEGCE